MKINIHDSTYIFLLLSFLSGYFEYIIIFLIIIFIHEYGHYIFALIVGVKSSSIEIYPFGGLTKYNSELNISIIRELFCLFGGITFQILLYLLIHILFKNYLVTYHVFNIFKKINILLISFNFLPILPLDGGKLLNLILDYFFSYKVSNIISIFISIIFTIIFFISKRTIFSIILTLFLIKNIYYEIINLKYKYNKFLLERYLNKYNFKRINIIKNGNYFKRGRYHIINNMYESKYLSKLFDIT